jgi:FixJ family two-component response regulator
MESLDAVCLLLDLDSATADAIADAVGQTSGMRLIHTSREALFAGGDVNRCGCVLAVSDESDSWSLPRRLYEHPSPLRVVFLALRTEIRAVVEASRNGADDVVAWPAEAQHLPRAIQRACAASGQSTADVERCLEARRRLSQLTSGERDVMHLMLDATANKNIAARLDIAMRTVEARRKEIFAKLGTRSSAQIFAMLQHAERSWAPGNPAVVPYSLPHGTQSVRLSV